MMLCEESSRKFELEREVKAEQDQKIEPSHELERDLEVLGEPEEVAEEEEEEGKRLESMTASLFFRIQLSSPTIAHDSPPLLQIKIHSLYPGNCLIKNTS